jgi:hypothetical protein
MAPASTVPAMSFVATFRYRHFSIQTSDRL